VRQRLWRGIGGCFAEPGPDLGDCCMGLREGNQIRIDRARDGSVWAN